MGGREVSRPYRVWFFAEGEWFLSFWRCHRPRKRVALVMWRGWFKPQLEIRHATALTTGAKHWHRRKAVFYVFCFSAPPVFILWTFFWFVFWHMQTERTVPLVCGKGWGGIKKASFERRLLVTPEGLEPSTHWLRVNCSTNWATESWCLFVSELRVQSYDNFWNLQKKSAFF